MLQQGPLSDDPLEDAPAGRDFLVIWGNGSPTKNAKHKHSLMFPKHVRALREGNSLDGQNKNSDAKLNLNGYFLGLPMTSYVLSFKQVKKNRLPAIIF